MNASIRLGAVLALNPKSLQDYKAGKQAALGGVVGMVTGGVLALGVSQLTPVPANVPVWSVAAALAASALTGIGFGLYPAVRAARLDPVEALRYE